MASIAKVKSFATFVGCGLGDRGFSGLTDDEITYAMEDQLLLKKIVAVMRGEPVPARQTDGISMAEEVMIVIP